MSGLLLLSPHSQSNYSWIRPAENEREIEIESESRARAGRDREQAVFRTFESKASPRDDVEAHRLTSERMSSFTEKLEEQFGPFDFDVDADADAAPGVSDAVPVSQSQGDGEPKVKVEPGVEQLSDDLLGHKAELVDIIDSIGSDAIDEEIAEFMKARVADSTRSSYISRLTTLIIWILADPTRHYLLNPTILQLLLDADKVDKSTKTKRGRRSKKRTHLRNAIKGILEDVDQSQAHTIPVVLGKLSFKLFSRYLSTFKKSVKKRSQNDTTVINGSVKICLSASSYDAACSALSYLFNETTKELWSRLASYKKGARRTGAKQRKGLYFGTHSIRKGAVTFVATGSSIAGNELRCP